MAINVRLMSSISVPVESAYATYDIVVGDSVTLTLIVGYASIFIHICVVGCEKYMYNVTLTYLLTYVRAGRRLGYSSVDDNVCT